MLADRSPINRVGATDLLLRIPHLTRESWQELSLLARWLVMIRAPVLMMTLLAVLISALCAVMGGELHWNRLLAVLIGLTFAHALNNLINDWVDWRRGLDRKDYFRHQYGAHTLEQGFVSERTFLLLTALTGAIALAAGTYLVLLLGLEILLLMLAGAFFVVFYTWPLKHIALGELSVLLVWGPMMIGGSYFVLTDTMTPFVLIVSVIYGLGTALVIMGKHMDKLAQDRARGVRTLPVLLGDAASRKVCTVAILLQWLMVMGSATVFPHGIMLWLLIFSLPAARSMILCLRRPVPLAKPLHYPDSIWPLWLSAHAFRYNRDFGLLLVSALFVTGLVSGNIL